MIKIGDLAKICNVSTQTLRYYDSEGILKADIIDSSSGYRFYSLDAIEKYKKIIYCLSLYDFVHEYVHIVMENNTELVYVPAEIFREGFAQYVSLNFFDNISESSYSFFKEPPISKNSNEAEHNQISKLLTDNDLEYNAKNYTKAFVYLYSRNYDLSELDTSSDFYNYYVGYLLTEYCVNELGGLNRFISVYYDSITIEETYGKTLYEIINKACDNNEKLFK